MFKETGLIHCSKLIQHVISEENIFVLFIQTYGVCSKF